LVYKFKNFDLSLPRTENKTGEGHKAFEVAYSDDERAASLRRDFTVNAMMINIFDGSFLDFYGGERDLRRGILRRIDDFDGLYGYFTFTVYESFERRRYFDIIESKNYL